jgi:hypothetical protein
MMAQLAGNSPGLARRVVSWLLLPICYLGALIAPAVILAVPFQIFHARHFSPAVFWVSMVLIGALVLWQFYRALISSLRFFRQRVIYVEAIVMVVAFVAAVTVVIWIYPPR